MRAVVDRALMVCLVVGVPLTVLMALLGDWGMQILFMRGAFDLAAANAAGAILAAYALGLIPALAVRSLVASFHGRGDTRTPLRILAMATVLNIGLKVALTPTLGAMGLALATSVGMVVYVFGLGWVALRNGYWTGVSAGKFLTIAIVGAVSVILLLWWKKALLYQLGLIPAATVLIFVVIGVSSGGAYLVSKMPPRR